jgi:hypothetical protein
MVCSVGREREGEKKSKSKRSGLDSLLVKTSYIYREILRVNLFFYLKKSKSKSIRFFLQSYTQEF